MQRKIPGRQGRRNAERRGLAAILQPVRGRSENSGARRRARRGSRCDPCRSAARRSPKAGARRRRAPPAAPAAAGAAVFPSAVSAAHASEKPGKARMLTCLDQYKANKETNGNGGLKWISKGRRLL